MANIDINNEIASANTKNSMFDFSALDDALAAQATDLAAIATKREETRAAREKVLAEDTIIGVGFIQRGMLASVTGSFSDGFTKPLTGAAVTNTGVTLTSEEGSLMAVNNTVKTAAGAGKKHIVIYTNPGSVLRLSGMVKRIADNNDTVLTKGEAEFVAKYARRYGSHYGTVCKVVFATLKAALADGKVLSFHGIDELGSIPLQYRVPVKTAGETVELKRGYARIEVDGRQYTVKAKNSFVSGEYKLVADSFGHIALEDPIDEAKAPGKALAFKLFQFASRAATIKNADEQASAAMEEATGTSEAA